MQQRQHSLRKRSSCFCNGLAREGKGMPEQCTHHTIHSKQYPSYFSSSNLLHHLLQQHELLLTIFWCTPPSVPGKRPQTGTWMHVSQRAAVFSKLKPWWWEIPVPLTQQQLCECQCRFQRACVLDASRFIYRHSKKSVWEAWWDVYNPYSASPLLGVNPSLGGWLITGAACSSSRQVMERKFSHGIIILHAADEGKTAGLEDK